MPGSFSTAGPSHGTAQDRGIPCKKEENENQKPEGATPAASAMRTLPTRKDGSSPKKCGISSKNIRKAAIPKRKSVTAMAWPRHQPGSAPEERRPASPATTLSKRRHGALGGTGASAAKPLVRKSSLRTREPRLHMRKPAQGQDVKASLAKKTEEANKKESKAKASKSVDVPADSAVEVPGRHTPALALSTDDTFGGRPGESTQEGWRHMGQKDSVVSQAEQWEQRRGCIDEVYGVRPEKPEMTSAKYVIQKGNGGPHKKDTKDAAIMICNVDENARSNEDSRHAARLGEIAGAKVNGKSGAEGGPKSTSGAGLKHIVKKARGAGVEVPALASKSETLHGNYKKPGRFKSPVTTPETSAYQYAALKELAAVMKAEPPTQTRMSTRQLLQFENLGSRACSLVAFLGILAATAVLLGLFLRRSPEAAQQACASAACEQLSAAFDATLNYSADPCVDMDKFVCSKWLSRGVGGGWGAVSTFEQNIQEYELQMVDLFLQGKTTFTASRILSPLLTECAGGYEKPPSIEKFRDFFDHLHVRWPFNHTADKNGRPLQAVLSLSLSGGVDTWFRAYLQNARQRPSPFNASSKTVLFIEVSGQASLWLDLVDSLQKPTDRRAYYLTELYKMYNARLPDSDAVARLLDTERAVLSVLDAVRVPGTMVRSAVASLAQIVANVRNSTLDEWIAALKEAPGGRDFDETMLVSVEDVRILWAIDKLLFEHNGADLVDHLSLWAVQILTVLGWPQGFYFIAGSREAAKREVKMECHSLMAKWFGLLLASESAVNLFTREARREVETFFDHLRGVLTEVIANTSLLSDKDNAAVAGRVQDLEVVVWPLDVARSNETLWRLYGNFSWSSEHAEKVPKTPESQEPLLMEYWMHASSVFWGLTDEDRERMQFLWAGDDLEVLRYEPWTNRLRVSHAVLRSPFYYPASAELRKANFGGLGAAFYLQALQMFAPPDEGINASAALAPWTDLGDIRHRAKSLRCDPEFLANLLDIAALGLAWQALNSTGGAPPSETANATRSPDFTLLPIRDDRKQVHLYSAEQVFFLTYCRSRCRRKTGGNSHYTGCNAAVRSIRHFGQAFRCQPGSAMSPRETCELSDFL